MTGTSQQAYKIKSLLVAITSLCFKPAVRGRCNKARFWHMWWTVSCVPSGWRFGSLLGCPPSLSQSSLVPVYLTNPCSHLTSLLTPRSSEPFSKWARWGEKLEGWHPCSWPGGQASSLSCEHNVDTAVLCEAHGFFC